MKPSSTRKQWVRWLGNFLSFLGIVFVGKTLHEQSTSLNVIIYDKIFYLACCVSVLAWQVVNGCIGIGWNGLLRYVGYRIDLIVALELTYRTQIAKYIPGNVFHLVGRAIGLRREPNSASKRFISLALESIILVSEAGAVWLCYLIWGESIVPLLIIPPIGGLASVLIVVPVLNRIKRLDFESVITPRESVNVLFISSVYYFVFLVQTIIFWIVMNGINSTNELGFWTLHSVLTVSWVAGYLVVGSPGGIGVREGIFGLLVAENSMAPTLLLTLVIVRCISMIGDLVSYIAAFLIRLKISKEYDLDICVKDK